MDIFKSFENPNMVDNSKNGTIQQEQQPTKDDTTGITSSTKNTNNDDSTATIININVGVLGHVDSGKTSLVKALSTMVSTAALDKSKQSRERGMTLDLGFSCFFLSIRQQQYQQQNYNVISTQQDNSVSLNSNNNENANNNESTTTITSSSRLQKYQITLVDCPGHASLIRTIIGGAQIIDMVVLVVDVVKGWQAQTTECLCLAELTSSQLIVVLNKIDQLDSLVDPKERDQKLQSVRKDIEERLKYTRFSNNNNNNNTNNTVNTLTTKKAFKQTPIIGVSACVGGQKVAAIGGGGSDNTSLDTIHQAIETYNLDKLLLAIEEKIRICRSSSQPHPTMAQTPRETAATTTTTTTNKLLRFNKFYFAFDHCFLIRGRGTVLTGTCLAGQISVNDTIELPTYGIERKIKSIQMFKQQVITIQQGDRAGICINNIDTTSIERGIISSPPNSIPLWKYGIAIVRKIQYYPNKLLSNTKFHISVGHTTIMATVTFWGAQELYDEHEQKESLIQSQVINTDITGLPKLSNFDYNVEYIQQDEYIESIKQQSTTSSTDEITTTTTKGEVNTKKKTAAPKSYPLHWALLNFQTPVYCPIHSLIIGSRLDTDITDSNSAVASAASHDDATASSCRLAFSGRLIERIDNETDIDRIKLYTTKERKGIVCKLGDVYRRVDDNKIVRYDIYGTSLFKKETNMKLFIGMKIILVSTGDIGEIKSSYGTDGKFRIYFPAGIVTTAIKVGDPIVLNFRRYIHDPQKVMYQNHIVLPTERPGNRIDNTTSSGENSTNNKNKKKSAPTKKLPPGVNQVGTITSIKQANDGGETETSSAVVVIISGFFVPEISIKEYVGTKVKIVTTNEIGTITGPFGKAGKCKVLFDTIISANINDKVELQYQ